MQIGGVHGSKLSWAAHNRQLLLGPVYDRPSESMTNRSGRDRRSRVRQDPLIWRQDLREAISSDDAAQCEILFTPLLINAMARPNLDTPMHRAAMYNSAKVIQAFIHKGGNATKKDVHGMTPLMYAADKNSTDAICALVHDGIVPIDEINKKGDTALHRAITKLNDEAVKLLLSLGASVNLRNFHYCTPLHMACRKLQDEQCTENLIFMLLEHGSDPNAVDGLELDPQGAAIGGMKTPLHYAAESERSDVVKVLLQKGGNPRIRDGVHKQTPLDFCAADSPCALLLIAPGVNSVTLFSRRIQHNEDQNGVQSSGCSLENNNSDCLNGITTVTTGCKVIKECA